jgi:WD40 repeat protein
VPRSCRSRRIDTAQNAKNISEVEQRSEDIRCASPALRLWDASTGRAVASPMQHDYRVDGAAFASDGKTIITWGDHTISVWNASTAESVGAPFGHRNVIDVIPMGEPTVFVSYSENLGRVWNLSSESTPLASEAELDAKVKTGTELLEATRKVSILRSEAWATLRDTYCRLRGNTDPVCQDLSDQTDP